MPPGSAAPLGRPGTSTPPGSASPIAQPAPSEPARDLGALPGALASARAMGQRSVVNARTSEGWWCRQPMAELEVNH
ncbi:unnamed protein product [Coccothraustes coccothraustes]